MTQESGAEDLWGSKATRAASWSGPGGACRGSFFPPKRDTGWSEKHGRLVRGRIQTVVVSAEEIGLCGCWLLILVEEWQQRLRRGRVIREWEEFSYSCTRAAPDACRAAEWLGFIRGHWAARENGSHDRREMSLGKEVCRVRGQNRAHMLARLRNGVLGLFEWQRRRGRSGARSFRSWRRPLTVGQMIGLILRRQ
ncbi:MAG: hypothetical protein KatS3mg132_163 [Limisphaera sp.]|nr:MAG: hypothetical protein KatS3mg132_163 [Limisphaera sp.]